ncbi:MAG: phosphatase PAP2 family protein [Muribaculaceae bacterium]|nr:phosphatase PAP2 family protein [Muribaculaceae bacterium]
MMKRVRVIFTITVALLSMNAQATDVTGDIPDLVSAIDTTAAVIDEDFQEAIGVADTVPVNTADTLSSRDIAALLESHGGCGIDADPYRKYNGPDFHFFENTTNPYCRPYSFLDDQTWVGIPVFVAGWILKGEKKAFRQNYNNPNTKIRLIKYNFHSKIDDFTQYTGLALSTGLKLAGVEGRSSWPRFAASTVASYAVMAALVNGIKFSVGDERPDSKRRNSWPSGHTATAFVAATILHKEYGLTRSPWYSIAGYSVATATGVMRVLNNRHWISDVLSGAGIGILSAELGYGICDLLFKRKGLLMHDHDYDNNYPNENPSFFSISMGIGLGNKDLTLPPFDFYGFGDEHDNQPISLKFGSSTAVGAEGAFFFNRYIGVGARLRVKATPIRKWSSFATSEEEFMRTIFENPELKVGVTDLNLTVESDHIAEFAADAGLYFNLPLSSRFALGTKVLFGRSVMDDVDVNGHFAGYKMKMVNGRFVKTEEAIACDWDYIDLSASNSYKFGSGFSVTYAYKNAFSWRVFVDYDYATKTYTASYAPLKYIKDFMPDVLEQFEGQNFNPTNTFTSSARKHLHQWILGGALCVSF